MRTRDILTVQRESASSTIVTIGDVTVLVSYAEPVAFHVAGVGYVATAEKFSPTTSRHVSAFTGKRHREVDAEMFRGELSRALADGVRAAHGWTLAPA